MRRELGYEQLASNFATTSADADVPGLSVVVEVGARPLLIRVWSQAGSNSSANNFAQAKIKEGATTIADGTLIDSTAASKQETVLVESRESPTPGTHTYKVSFGRSAFSGAGTASLAASGTTPAFIQVFEI